VTASVSQLAQLLDSTGELVEAVRDSQWAAPTPCSEWNVRELVNHVVGGNQLYAGILSGRTTLEDARRSPAVDLLGDAPLTAYRDSADAVVEAFSQPGALERTVTVVFGTVPGLVALHLRLTDVLVHGWDLARATHQTTSYPDHVVEQELQFSAAAVKNIPPERTPFAPPQPVDDGAPAIDRLAALLGRTVS
jgi:uncharacterized protein (TIGR03086 family)